MDVGGKKKKSSQSSNELYRTTANVSYLLRYSLLAYESPVYSISGEWEDSCSHFLVHILMLPYTLAFPYGIQVGCYDG